MSANPRRNPATLRAAARAAPRPRPLPPTPPQLAKAFDFFDRCYLLNLDRDVDRLARASARLRRLGAAFERFAALGPPVPCPSFAGRPSLTPGLFACARSHLAVLRRAMQRGERRVLVVEDDAVCRDDTAEWMGRLLPQLEKVGWDVLHLGLHLVRGEGKVAENLGRVGESFHTHAYAVTARAMPVLAAVIEASMREGFHFDCFDHPLVAGAAGAAGLVRVYADPILAVQEPGESRVLGEAVDRLVQYFPPFDREEFMRHCEEARGWGMGGGADRGSGPEGPGVTEGNSGGAAGAEGEAAPAGPPLACPEQPRGTASQTTDADRRLSPSRHRRWGDQARRGVMGSPRRFQESAPHPDPLPWVQGRGGKKQTYARRSGGTGRGGWRRRRRCTGRCWRGSRSRRRRCTTWGCWSTSGGGGPRRWS